MEPTCSECELSVKSDEICVCGGLPEFPAPNIHIFPSGFRHTVRQRRASYNPMFSSGVWRYLELLPPIERSSIISLGEGNMPLYESSRGAGYCGVDRLAYLHLGMNPTGSFKDLGMTLAVSAARARGAHAVACASTGNTASSMAAYASRAGLEAFAVMPRGRVSQAKLAQLHDYDARVIETEGSFDDAFAKVRTMTRSVTVVNSINPYRIEGQKCAAFALLELRGWDPPDWIALPAGNLGNVRAIGKGLCEALALGLIDRLPRIAAVQACGAAPFVHVWQGRGELVPVIPQTRASAIAIGSPKSWRRALRTLDACNGAAVAVDDDAIDMAKAQIGAEGIGCEPASAAALAGVRTLQSSNIISPESDVVVILTGHVLKDSDASLRIRDLRSMERAREYHVSGV